MLIDLNVVEYYFISLGIVSEGRMESISSRKKENLHPANWSREILLSAVGFKKCFVFKKWLC